MKQQIVVTNVRMPYDDWLQVKSVASDSGMSINEYFNVIARADITEKTLGVVKKKTSKRHLLEDIAMLASMPNKPMGELSEEDKIIYGE